MREVVLSILVFIILYLFYYITVIRRQKKLDKFMEGMEVTYLKGRYKIDLRKVNKKRLASIIALTNSFIISLTVLIVTLVDNYILKLMIAFIVLFPLIIILYHIIGTRLSKKEG